MILLVETDHTLKTTLFHSLSKTEVQPCAGCLMKYYALFASSSTTTSGQKLAKIANSARWSHYCRTIFHDFLHLLSLLKKSTSLQHMPRQTEQVKLRQLQGRKHILLPVNEA